MIIPRDQHCISRANISENALKVLYRLKNAGYGAYLVGGGVRDLSLGREPKDFDIATDATPDDVKALFRNCRLIGRRFRLAHVHFGREIIEVATFRALHDGERSTEPAPGDQSRVVENGMIVRDNVYGSIEEDALRRDFTVNALYYNIEDFSVVDYVGGMDDLEHGAIRLIGDADVRYREDPVRMLRAVRFAVKLGFRIDESAAAPMREMAGLLGDIPPARLFEEVLKLFFGGQALETFELLRHHDLFRFLFPVTDDALDNDEHGQYMNFVSRALDNTDRRIAEDRPVTPAFLFAALLWPAIHRRIPQWLDEAPSYPQALQEAATEATEAQLRRVTIPKRFTIPMREIWSLQPRFDRCNTRRAQRLSTHPRFRAAYDFLLLRAESGEIDPAIAQWWTDFQASAPPAETAPERPRRRRRGGRRRHGGRSEDDGGGDAGSRTDGSD